MANDITPPPSAVELVGSPRPDSIWKLWFENLQSALTSNFAGVINAGKITGDTTLDETYYVVYCDTDGGAITVTLPAGDNGRTYRVINTGSSGNDVTLTPNGSELLNGFNASETLIDAENLLITFETTEGWW